ncbi:50S ribosomal protein L3 [Candidatus Parcubacteria bacterium]|nr:50S ribosomal protein L3 [Candidatus Parcubacteria bacterium]
MKILTTKKVNMTQVFDESGRVLPVTVLVSTEDVADTFQEGEVVAVTGTSKGKGFQGVVKRHGFHGGPRSHGQKHSEREPGSLGGGGRDGGRVAKGKRMAGRMGGDTITVRNLKVVKIIPESKEILISGAIPGRRGSVVKIKVK